MGEWSAGRTSWGRSSSRSFWSASSAWSGRWSATAWPSGPITEGSSATSPGSGSPGWGIGGWIRNMGALDFAGGTVVHITSGVSALAAALVVGKRKGFGSDNMAPHNLPMTVIGAAILWFGWFGFNAGSALAAGELSTSAFVATHLAAASATLSWAFTEWIHRSKPTVLGAASGCVAGLVAIPPASGFVTPISAIAIGLAGGAVCYRAVVMKGRPGYGDPP